uniref:Ras and EF-hand domain-containing protein n=1 Tax=Syphacia muris TaxID=451379 RepID=A0A0N5A8T4_9BILA
MTLTTKQTNQDEVLLLYEQLQASGMGKLLTRFEKIVGNFCKELQDRKDENRRLQHVYESLYHDGLPFSERQLYNRRMLEVENEMDQHILETERRIREEEQKRLTWEKEEMRLKLETEMAELKENVARMKKLEATLNNSNCRSEQTAELKAKLKELSDENDVLKSNLADSHIELALIKSELLNVKSEYESTKEELLSDSEVIQQAEKQSQNLQRQLQLLYDANKKLHDTNDSLRGALSQRNSLYKQIRRLSLIPSETQDNVDEGSNNQVAQIVPSEIKHQPSINMPLTYSMMDDEHTSLVPKNASSNKCNTRVDSIPDDEFVRLKVLENASGIPERTFRIVMCGEAAVGKSSIVQRIIKGAFTQTLPSTLGVDFYVKTIRIERKIVAIQLWDTAGQERFRSLCKSYFRRADGAILVYDCSVERTFGQVREWTNTIRESTLRPIPIMICGNKIDLRRGHDNTCGFVTAREGETIAEALGAIFAECSALDGTNIDNAFYILARELMATEDVEVKSTGVTLAEKKTSGCCGRR